MKILFNPLFLHSFDRDTLLVYSDWLEEEGDLIQANIIRKFKYGPLFDSGLVELSKFNLILAPRLDDNKILYYEYELKFNSIYEKMPINNMYVHLDTWVKNINIKLLLVNIDNPYFFYEKSWDFTTNDLTVFKFPSFQKVTEQKEWPRRFCQ